MVERVAANLRPLQARFFAVGVVKSSLGCSEKFLTDCFLRLLLLGRSIWLGLLGAFYMVSPDPAARSRCTRAARAPLRLGTGAFPLLFPTHWEFWAAMACA